MKKWRKMTKIIYFIILLINYMQTLMYSGIQEILVKNSIDKQAFSLVIKHIFLGIKFKKD